MSLLLLYVGFGALVVIVGHRIRSRILAFPQLPRLYLVVSPASALVRYTDTHKYWSLGKGWAWRKRHSLFHELGTSIISVVSIRSLKSSELLVADPVLIKHIGQDRNAYPKPRSLAIGAMASLGPNVVTTDGNQWKRHRRITSRGFTDKHHQFVWESSVDIIKGLFSYWISPTTTMTSTSSMDTSMESGITHSKNNDSIVIENFDSIAQQIALKVLCQAGFDLSTTWEKSSPPIGHDLTFEETVHRCLIRLFDHHILPTWYLNMSSKGRETIEAYQEFEKYMQEMIQDRRGYLQHMSKRNDLLSHLVDAETGEKPQDEDSLSYRELAGNLFIFLLAGHDTTAHTLSFTIARLAVHQHEQELVYREICSVLQGSHDRTPTFDDMPQLKYTLAFVFETLRLHPILGYVHKEAAEDRVEQTSTGPISIPKGTRIQLNFAAVHYNPELWEQPFEFRPSRFLGPYNKDAFLPFSLGSRSCLGRKFAETEIIATIITILLRHRIEITDEPQYRHESPEERAARVLDCDTPITLTPKRVPVTLRPRREEGLLL